MADLAFIAINVGNTRTHVARLRGQTIENAQRLPGDDVAAIVRAVIDEAGVIGPEDGAPVVIASVNDRIARQVESGVHDQLSLEIYRIGMDLPVPIATQLEPETMTGVDRLLNAAAAYATLQQACVVVDAGTAITVDFVDGRGTFHGGAIAPGASMQLAALHAGTDALPDVRFGQPEGWIGGSTAQAMLQGVFYGLRGLVWKLTERYAEHYGAYPTVIATGGDAAMLFGEDSLVDRIVPDLTLMGIAETVRVALAVEGEGGGFKRRPDAGGER